MMRFRNILLWLILFTATTGQGQSSRISDSDLALLQSLDDSLNKAGSAMLDEPLPTDRIRADSLFTRLLVRALRTPWSFYYTFDSMQMAPVIYPADSSFRIITWHYPMDDNAFRQKGAIQMNTPDGSLKLFPLFDASEYTEEPSDSIRSVRNWIGAVYYAIIENEASGKPVYTLLGYDENNDITTRKWIDILRFNGLGEPVFGGHEFFAFNNDSILPRTAQRYLMEYKKEGRARLNYDPEEKMIIMDHLVSETNEPEKRYTLVPGGDYEALKWENGQWTYIERLFVDALGDGNEPKPALILNDQGLANESVLQQQSEKNMTKAKEDAKKAETKSTKPKRKND